MFSIKIYVLHFVTLVECYSKDDNCFNFDFQVSSQAKNLMF